MCGLDHTLLLADSGQVFSCGWGADGQTGTLDKIRTMHDSKKVKIYFDVVLVLFTSLLGIGGYSAVSSPTRVQLPSDLSFSSVYTCADTSFAQTSESVAEPNS